MKERLAQLKKRGRELYLLSHATDVVHWDMETYMPAKGADERAEQLALLEGLSHQKATAPELGELFEALRADSLDDPEHPVEDQCDKAYIREFFRNYKRQVKLPGRLVEEFARETGRAHAVWIKAKEEQNFTRFQGNLEAIIGLCREKAECLGYEEHPYDALLDEFEPWMTTGEVETLFGDLKAGLTTLVAAIAEAPPVEAAFLQRDYPVSGQEKLGRMAVEALGYPWDRGRVDITAHPFTTTLGQDDVRITTRYFADNVLSGLFSNIHEAGHGLYELGFGPEIAGNLLADGASLGIHESQSRTWENMIGRSRAFWDYFYPRFQEIFPDQTANVSLDQFYRAVNQVQPSLIRVDADEVTYSLHVILRFELEKALLEGSLKVSDLPEAWNAGMKELLGITPENDAVGVLQDVHWSAGLVGYFPTYALGNLYGAQFYRAMDKALGGLDRLIAQGQLAPVLQWLRENIHRYGSRYSAGELCLNATGEKLDAGYFMGYLERKYAGIYGLDRG